MNKLAAIRTFVRVAEQGGFTAASRKLDTSVSAITKLVARLEDDLGTRLFARTTRRFVLTDAGEEFYGRMVRMLADLDEAENAVRLATDVPTGPVRAAVPFFFGRATLVPQLPRFFARYPGVKVHLTFSDRPIDLFEDGFDVAIRTGDQSDSRLIRRALTRGPGVTFASPAYIAKHGRPAVPDDLRAHNCIVSRFGPDWHYRTPGGERHTVRVDGNLTVLSGDANRGAALAGIGIAHANSGLVQKDLHAGTLVAMLTEYELDGAPVSLVYPATQHLPAKVRVFIDFLVEVSAGELHAPPAQHDVRKGKGSTAKP
jgi:DNA-binding transcriptional LysR family regulator